MEVKIGVQNTPREIVLESSQTPEEVQALVSQALQADTTLSLTDDKDRLVIVPAKLIAYVEIAKADVRRVGFAN